ncbi:MAG: hypothetical protein JO184_04505 [Gammaproteobacteria bacterium]|nr:hypothetical protein [Gammaproteobacteria bacterium]MBV8402611.1 hypothetical protein [Gammaproteobacteria bacterium]
MIDYTTTVLRHLTCVGVALIITSVAGASFVQATASVPVTPAPAVTAVALSA